MVDRSAEISRMVAVICRTARKTSKLARVAEGTGAEWKTKISPPTLSAIPVVRISIRLDKTAPVIMRATTNQVNESGKRVILSKKAELMESEKKILEYILDI